MNSKQYAELAHQANMQGKILIKHDNAYRLENPPPPTITYLVEQAEQDKSRHAQSLISQERDAYMMGDTDKQAEIKKEYKAMQNVFAEYIALLNDLKADNETGEAAQ